ncbi:MAG TPA: transposase, partial [Gemmataceae bacterium]|nr:transposase [Gemmataceae bacterium]
MDRGLCRVHAGGRLKQYDALFDRPPPRPTEVGCWAHARRKFHDARTADPARAHEAIARIRRLHDIEAEIKPLDDPGRRAARHARSRPLLVALFEWLNGQHSQVLPRSPIGVAIGYTLGNRAALTRSTDAGLLSIDNNASERALRAVAVGRKNYLFAGSDAGGQSAAVLYSVVGTCRRLGLDPFAYQRDALAQLPALTVGRVDDFLPDRWAAGRAGTAPRREPPAGMRPRPGPTFGRMPIMSDVTQILAAVEAGDPKAAAELLPLVYDELRKLAAARLAEEKPGQTLQPTALVHEAYLRLVGGGQTLDWNSRGHFFAAAAEAMRRILVDAARRKRSLKAGGALARQELEAVDVAVPE